MKFLKNVTLEDLRAEARNADESHIMKVRGTSPSGQEAYFTALLILKDGKAHGYLEGELGIPNPTLRLFNDFATMMVWGQPEQFYMVPRKSLDYRALTGHSSHRWDIRMPHPVDVFSEVSEITILREAHFPGKHHPEHDPERYSA